MFNFNEQGKFESQDTAKEHYQKIEGDFPSKDRNKSAKDIAIGVFAVIALIAGIILLVYTMKG